jgi:hypothetical protein
MLRVTGFAQRRGSAAEARVLYEDVHANEADATERE